MWARRDSLEKGTIVWGQEPFQKWLSVKSTVKVELFHVFSITEEGRRRHNAARRLPVERDNLVLTCCWMMYIDWLA